MAKIAINIATGSLQQQEIIVGIDLGTTNSLVAIIHPEGKKPVGWGRVSYCRQRLGLTLVGLINGVSQELIGHSLKKFLVDAYQK